MRRIIDVLRTHVLQETCFEIDGAAEGQMGGGSGRGDGQGGIMRCWEEPFSVDIRYNESTNQV